jgi:hypothetical protein
LLRGPTVTLGIHESATVQPADTYSLAMSGISSLEEGFAAEGNAAVRVPLVRCAAILLPLSPSHIHDEASLLCPLLDGVSYLLRSGFESQSLLILLNVHLRPCPTHDCGRSKGRLPNPSHGLPIARSERSLFRRPLTVATTLPSPLRSVWALISI